MSLNMSQASASESLMMDRLPINMSLALKDDYIVVRGLILRNLRKVIEKTKEQ